MHSVGVGFLKGASLKRRHFARGGSPYFDTSGGFHDKGILHGIFKWDAPRP